MKEVVVVSGVRTAIGKFGGSLMNIAAIELGGLTIEHALKKAGIRPVADDAMRNIAPDSLKNQARIGIEEQAPKWDPQAQPVRIDEVVVGNVLQAGLGQNPGRQAMIRAGVPKETPGLTINKVCGSGLKAVALATQAIMTDQADVIVACGMENMSQVPMALKNARWGHRMELTGIGQVHDLMVYDGLYEIFYGYHMGHTAENIQKLYDISRNEQDELGVQSHQRAIQAIKNGWFKDEIVPLTIKSKKADVIFDTDERPMETSFEKMSAMKPAFEKNGTVTAGNASGINDAAAAVVLMSAEKAKELGLEPFVKIRSFASGGVDPAYMGLGPVPAVRKALKQAGMTMNDLDLIELNEAFAAQAIGCFRELGLDNDKPNQMGSGISLGHPIGCTGARMLVTAMHAMRRLNQSTGLISMCIGGGMGMAMIVER